MDCETCPSEPECHYPYKPCECVSQRKFWDADRRAEFDAVEAERTREQSNLVYERGKMVYGGHRV